MTSSEIEALVAAQLGSCSEAQIREAIRALLVPPTAHLREFTYARSLYECWTVLEHPESDTAIVFSNFGFGPKCPWGLIGLTPPLFFGDDSGWFTSLEDAFCDSWASNELRINNVVEETPEGELNVLATGLTSKEAFEFLPATCELEDFTVQKLFLDSRRHVMSNKQLRVEMEPSKLQERHKFRRTLRRALKKKGFSE
jgi:hypothetical protein